MGKLLQLLVLILLIMSACEKDEEILPIPPQTEESPPAVVPKVVAEKSKPPLDVDAELYQFGEYGKMPYRILIPRNYDSTKSYPLHVFLHGIGERGNDNEKQLSVGAIQFQADSVREKYPSFVVFPQCPEAEYWFGNDVMNTIKGLIDSLLTLYLIDENKVSIGGFSMGAYGTFAMVAKYPGLFQSAVAISGDGDEDRAGDMSKPTWQLFAGARDGVVSSSKTEKMATALSKAGATVIFKLYPEADHTNVWQNAFSEPGFFSRLFNTERSKKKNPRN